MIAVGLETRIGCRAGVRGSIVAMTAVAPSSAPRDGGMTLLELMVVAGILAALLGLGVGFLRRSDGMPETRSAITGALRAAALDARTRGLPTEVVLDPGADGAPATVTARGLDPVAIITFEPGQQFAYAGIEPALGGEEVPAGRLGRGRTTKAGDNAPALRLPFGQDVADLGFGFALRLDVLLQQRTAGRLLRLGRGVEVQLDDLGRPQARIQPGGENGRGGAAVNLLAQVGLPVGQWCTLEVGHDGSRAWLAVDGRELATATLRDRLLQQKGDAIEVLPADEALPAVVDELQVFAYALLPPVRLPDGVQLAGPLRIAFDVLGEPIAPPAIKLEVLADHRIETLAVGPGGVLQ